MSFSIYSKPFIFAALCLCGLCSYAGESSGQGVESARHKQRLQHRSLVRELTGSRWWQNYAEWMSKLDKEFSVQAGADVSYVVQRASPSGKQTAIQGVYYPFLQWTLWDGSAWGSGTINASYTFVHYWGIWADTLQERIGAAAPLNDSLTKDDSFSQLSYTHTLPGKWDWLSVTAGQFSFGDFDGTTYLGNQQTALMNGSFSQNLSAAYPGASLGMYVQAERGEWNVSAGYQDATNISGHSIQIQSAFSGKYAAFGSAAWSPEKLGGYYSLLAYYQPAVEEQDENITGWSFNFQKDIFKKWVVFGRANYASGSAAEVQRSYVAGLGWKDPLVRHPQDIILLGAAYNGLHSTRITGFEADYETAIEIQWVWNLENWLSITPDIQLYPKTAGNNRRFAAVAGLRMTLML